MSEGKRGPEIHIHIHGGSGDAKSDVKAGLKAFNQAMVCKMAIGYAVDESRKAEVKPDMKDGKGGDFDPQDVIDKISKRVETQYEELDKLICEAMDKVLEDKCDGDMDKMDASFVPEELENTVKSMLEKIGRESMREVIVEKGIGASADAGDDFLDAPVYEGPVRGEKTEGA